ncbi:MAG: DUF4115 domain-containing protein, partial [Pseudonocardiales bacterium]
PKAPKAPKARPAPVSAMGSMAAGGASPRLASKRRTGANWTSAMLVAAAVVAILSVGIFALANLHRTFEPVDARSPAHPTPTPAAPSSTPVPSPSPSHPAVDGVTLRLQVAAGSSWVRVSDGSGRPIYEGLLTSGDRKDFSDPRSLTVRYGNSSVVSVLLNGQNKGSPASSCGGIVCTQQYVPGPAGG